MTKNRAKALALPKIMMAIFWLALFLPFSVLATDSPLIIGFDGDEVEYRKGNNYDYTSTEELGQLPIKILQQDAKSFLKIKTKKLGVIWVNKGDVKTRNQKKYAKNCRSIAIAKKSDSRQYGARGAGEECK